MLGGKCQVSKRVKSGVDSALSRYIDKYTYGLGPKWQQGLKDQDIAS